MDSFRLEDLWDNEAYGPTGEHLGRVEAVGMDRHRVPRRIGVRPHRGGPGLRFYSLTRARLGLDGVVIAPEPQLEVLRGAPS